MLTARIRSKAHAVLPPGMLNCDADATSVVRMGDEPDYDSSTVTLCKPCAVKAVEAFA